METKMPFKHSFVLTLNKTKPTAGGKGKREEVGKATIPCPTLEDFGIQAKQAIDEKTGAPQVENGLPVYDDPKFQWLMDAIQGAVSVKHRNKFDGGTLKPGMQVAEDFEALTAESARTGEALKLRREARSDFENYLRSLNKKETVVTVLGGLFWDSAKALATAS